MKVLVACEFSGIVREAFRKRGHDAWSNDILPAEDGSKYHIQGDIFLLLYHSLGTYLQVPSFRYTKDGKLLVDLMIHHWRCTNLASSGARWFAAKRVEQEYDIWAFRSLSEYEGATRIAGENPIGVLSTRYRKPDQIIQPWMFGHPESKATCLWLKGLPKLVPTKDVKAEMEALPLSKRTRVHYASPGPDRWKERSRTLQGIADAMAEQWGRQL